ncbi:AAA family ATPase [Streptomyces sp. NPDC001941]|uniref:LuxR C-terminal-related transcriptional regulator n=1 Tax=Streptomyces sp. NPDC001941 TaxID=3154659 RepID=UPI0033166E6B
MGAAPVVLVRRGGELALLESLLADARRGTGGAALVTGGPGSGKSALLDAFALRAARGGALVLAATASPAEADVPLGVAGQLLSTVREEPGEGPEALDEALRDRADGRPVAVLVDDVPYADGPSARCLLYLCGRLAARGVVLVLAARTGAAAADESPLAGLLRHPRLTGVALANLAESDVGELLAAEGVPARAADWYRFSGGNPALLRGLVEDHRACAPVRSSRPVAGAAFRRAVAGCLRGAVEGAADTARALAVLADTATLTRLARLLGREERAVGVALEALAAAGLLDGGRLRHEGVRAAVLAGLPPGEAARLHAGAARVLYEDGGELPLVARHLEAADGAGPGPAWAAPLLAEAARHAARAGGDGSRRAARFLRAAARRSDGDARLVPALARAEWELDPAAVARHLPVLEGGRSADAVGPLLWHGRVEAATRAARALEDPVMAAELADLIGYVYPNGSVDLSRRDNPVAPAGPVDLSRRDNPRAPSRGDRAGDPSPLVDPDAPEGVAERVLVSLTYGHAPAPGAPAVLAALLWAGETRRAAHWCALTDTEPAATSPTRRAVALAAAAVVRLRTGDPEGAAHRVRQALDLVPHDGWGVALGMPLAAGVLAAHRLGRPEEAARLLAVPVPDAMFRSRAGLHYLLARGRHHLALGRPRAALGDFHACRDALAGWRVEPAGALDWHPHAAEALRAGGGAPGEGGDPIDVLTEAERRVAVLVAQGCTNRSIAARLYVTPSTVEQHLTRIYRKLRVKTRTGLAELVVPTAS